MLSKWYVKPPSDQSQDGALVETDTGDGNTFEAALSYSLPIGNSGNYIITASILYPDSSTSQFTYSVYVY